jgi:hypothetical protein
MSKVDKILDMESEFDFEKEKINERVGQPTSRDNDKDLHKIESIYINEDHLRE